MNIIRNFKWEAFKRHYFSQPTEKRWQDPYTIRSTSVIVCKMLNRMLSFIIQKTHNSLTTPPTHNFQRHHLGIYIPNVSPQTRLRV